MSRCFILNCFIPVSRSKHWRSYKNSVFKSDNSGMQGLITSVWRAVAIKNIPMTTHALFTVKSFFKDALMLLKFYCKITIWPVKMKWKIILGKKSLFWWQKISCFHVFVMSKWTLSWLAHRNVYCKLVHLLSSKLHVSLHPRIPSPWGLILLTHDITPLEGANRRVLECAFPVISENIKPENILWLLSRG